MGLDESTDKQSRIKRSGRTLNSQQDIRKIISVQLVYKSVTTRNSDSLLFRQLFIPIFYIPTALYSDDSLFRQLFIPTTLYFDSSLFRQLFTPTDHYSDSSLFRQIKNYFLKQKSGHTCYFGLFKQYSHTRLRLTLITNR